MQAKISDVALAEYLAEAEEILQRVSSALSSLEKGEAIEKLLDGVYRDFHTLKGTSQLFGLREIGVIAHALEASFGPLRKFKVQLKSRFFDAVYSNLDLIDQMIKGLKQGDMNLRTFLPEVEKRIPVLIEASSQQFGKEQVIYTESWVSREVGDRNSIGAPRNEVEIPEVSRTEVVQPEGQRMSIVSEVAEASVLERPEKKETVPVADTTVRVQVELLDRMMNLAGELVLVRNQMVQYRNRNEDPEFQNLSKNLDLVTSELQAEVMKTRMQPIGNVVSKFQRVVRDLARDLNKQIDLTLQGTETEVDKTLLEAIRDPMTHLIRNSCDHGIETPEERRAAKKPATGHVSIRSYHEGGQVIVEISDDGKGLDRAKLVSKALEKSLISREKAEKLSDRESYQLIFLPGFSTAKAVTSVSGRGVGMDVVKTNIEKIGGTVELSSQLGKGTTIKLKIPLTLAIVPALIIRDQGNRYAIPQVKLVELVRVDLHADPNSIEFIQNRPMYRLRGALLPLVYLTESLVDRQRGENFENAEKALLNRDSVNLAVLNAEGERFGLVVDEILDTTDIVVKPLSPFLKTLTLFSGATIMGDGGVALILDVLGIAESAMLSVKAQKKLEAFDEKREVTRSRTSDVQEFLLFKTASETVHAIPLCLVQRLEEISSDKVEMSGNRRVLQYRGGILPVLSVAESLGYSGGGENRKTSGPLPLVVIQRSGRNYGIEVSEILDVIVVENPIDDSVRDRKGILGNVIVGEDILVIVDALGIIEDFDLKSGRKWEDGGAPDGGALGSSREAIQEIQRRNRALKQSRPKVLYAEDVAFFRKQVSKVLTKAGFDVVVAEHGAAALKILEEGQHGPFALILSDIEMPEMNGIQLAQAIRKLDGYAMTPLIALTTRFKESDIQAGIAAGFNLYLEKLNEEKLLGGISEVLQTTSSPGGQRNLQEGLRA